jgi:prophage DNA circulation protein
MAKRVGRFDPPPPKAAKRRRDRERRRDGRSWRDRLRPASFRGVPFYVDEASSEHGRRYHHHEYPQRDVPYAEDLGRKQRRYRVTGYAIGPGYMGVRDRLLTACEQPGPGKLVHPYLGELQVVCDGLQLRESDNEGGACRFELAFAEPGTRGTPRGRRALGAALRTAGTRLAVAAVDAFVGNTWRVEGYQDFVARAAAANLRELAAILEGLRGPTLPTAPPLEWRRRMLALAALDPATASPETIGAATVDAIAAFAESVPVAVALTGLEVLQTVTFTGPTPAPTTPARVQQAENAESLAALTHQGAIAALPAPVTAMPLQVYEDLVAVRSRVVAMCDRASDEAFEADAVYDAVDDVRAQCILELAVRGTSLRPLRRYVTAFPRPDLVLAHRLYGDPSRAEEVANRAGAVHPGFLPHTGLVAGA